MKRSKLEMYIGILRALARNGPLKATHIMYKSNLNYKVLKENLDFLLKQNLVEERTMKKEKIVFAITQRGITVLKYFHELEQTLPIVEESRTQKAIPY